MLFGILSTSMVKAQKPEFKEIKITNLANTHTYGGDGAEEVSLNGFRIEITFKHDFRGYNKALVTTPDQVDKLFDLKEYSQSWSDDWLTAGNMSSMTSSVDIQQVGKTIVILFKLNQTLLPNAGYNLRLNWGGVVGSQWVGHDPTTGNDIYDWVDQVNSKEFLFHTTSKATIHKGNVTDLCTNGDAETISDIFISEAGKYTFVPDQTETIVLEFDNPDFKFANANASEINIQMGGGGSSQINNVQVTDSQLSFEFSVDNANNLSNAISISGIKVKYVGSGDQSTKLQAKKTAWGHCSINGLMGKTLANVAGKQTIADASLNLDATNIIGSSSICKNTSTAYPYYVRPVPGASHYIWSVPDKFNITGHELVNIAPGLWQTPSNAINLGLIPSETYGVENISVEAITQCRKGTPTPAFPITVNSPSVVTFDKPDAIRSSEHPFVLAATSPAGSVRFSGIGVTEEHIFHPTSIEGPYPRDITIDYTFTNGSTGCITKGQFVIKVLDGRLPEGMNLKVTRNLDSPFINFKTSAGGVTPTWKWKWGFAGNQDSVQNPLLTLKNPQPQNISYALNIIDEKDRKYELARAFNVAINFTGLQSGKPTLFSKTMDLGISNDKINSIQWSFGDGGSSTHPTPQHTYAQPGSYNVILTIVAEDFITYQFSKQVDIFPVITIESISRYEEDFSKGANYWIARGSRDSASVQIAGCSWKLKTPAGFGNIPNNHGSGWITDNQDNPYRINTDANYHAEEQSYVESPSYDITQLLRPTISFDYWADTDAGSDGAVMLYTIDDGKNWFRAGKIDQGLEWYNSRPILGEPGKLITNDNVDNQGWSGNTQTIQTKRWSTARFALDEALSRMEDAGITQKIIRFRIAFGSNGDNTPNKKFDGFAFDNFQINNRNRLVLLEYFTSQIIDQNADKDKYVHKFSVDANEIINLHYHTDLAGKTEINNKNHHDPSGRVFHYGIRKAPQAAINGQTKESDNFEDEWANKIFFHHTLIASPFEISINKASAASNIVDFSATITALKDFSDKVVIHAVVVDSVLPTNGGVYHNVVRKMLPDASGTFRSKNWAKGEAQTLHFKWDTKGLPSAKFKVVVFIQDYDSKEVLQAAMSKPTYQRNQRTEEVDQVSGLAQQAGKSLVTVYPNPVANTLHIDAGIAEQTQWEIINTEGKIFKTGQVTKHCTQLRVNVSDLPRGMYIISLSSPYTNHQQKFRKH